MTIADVATPSSSPKVEPLRWEGQSLAVLDQRLLPAKTQYLACHTADDVAAAIHGMAVRGAPAIGIAAAYGVVLAAIAGDDLTRAHRVLGDSRPTAVNLRWALQRMQRVQSRLPLDLLAEARRIHEEDLAQNLKMAAFGAGLIAPESTVLTHCNTGALATGGHGTALGVIRTAWADGRIRQVLNTETRPWLQGARLTAYELLQEGIPTRLIADGAAAHVIQQERVDWVIVGADRIAANGDTANKIGTFTLAIAAKALGARVMVVAPTGTFDLSCESGEHIPIEDRGAKELTELQGVRSAPEGLGALNPVFDVTPAAYIDAIVCERGVIRDPNRLKIKLLLDE